MAPMNRARSSLPAPTNSPGCRLPRTKRAEGFNWPLVVPSGLVPAWVVRPMPEPKVRERAEMVPPRLRVPNRPLRPVELVCPQTSTTLPAAQAHDSNNPTASLHKIFMAAPFGERNKDQTRSTRPYNWGIGFQRPARPIAPLPTARSYEPEAPHMAIARTIRVALLVAAERPIHVRRSRQATPAGPLPGVSPPIGHMRRERSPETAGAAVGSACVSVVVCRTARCLLSGRGPRSPQPGTTCRVAGFRGPILRRLHAGGLAGRLNVTCGRLCRAVCPPRLLSASQVVSPGEQRASGRFRFSAAVKGWLLLRPSIPSRRLHPSGKC